jgi:hypothetical protein
MARGTYARRDPQEFKRPWRNNATHFVVDGQIFATGRDVFLYASRNLGYMGTLSAIAARLHAGQATWDKLLQYNFKYSASRRQTSIAEKNAEMAALIAGIDARKREIAARQVASASAEE